MDKKLLPKNFFKENPLDRLSAASFARVSMFMMWNDELQGKMSEVLDEEIEPERMERVEAEKKQIAQLKGGDETVKFIRSGYDIINREILCKKVLTMQAEVMPSLLRRFRTSFQNSLVETATCIFAYAEETYVSQLMELYPEIRNPYAQSMACLAFGIQGREDTLPLLLKEYQRMKEDDADGDLCQGPLMAIYILYGKA